MSGEQFRGKRLVAMGLGRSGLAVARAGLAYGAIPVVIDESPEEKLAKPELAANVREEGVELHLGWNGALADLKPDFVVVNPAIDQRHPKLRAARDAGIELLSEVEFAYRIAKGPIVGVTGTNGKSTTVVMTYLALQACGVEPILCGNLFGSGYPEAALTEAALNGKPGQPLVAEISSFGLEWTRQYRPRAAAITTIQPDHLNRYESFNEYAKTKMAIFAGQTDEDYAVVRANDPVVVPPGGQSNAYVPRHLRGAATSASKPHPKVLTFGATGEHARIEERDLQILDTRIPLDSLPWTEAHNHANAACAALLAFGLLRATGSPLVPSATHLPSQIVEGLKTFKGLAHRMELVGERDGVKVVNNSMCTNPDAVVASTLALRDPAHVLVGGANKGLEFASLGRFFGGGRNRVYLYGHDAAEIAKEMGGDYPIFETMAEAFQSAAAKAHAGEVVMLAPGCASSDQFRDFRHRGDVFREIAKEWLQR